MSGDKLVIVNLREAATGFQGAGCWSDEEQGWVRPEEARVYTQAELDAEIDDPAEGRAKVVVVAEDETVMSLDDARVCCDALLVADQLEEVYNPEGDGEHPDFTREDWWQQVINHETLCGYWQQAVNWLHERREEIKAERRATSGPAPGAA